MAAPVADPAVIRVLHLEDSAIDADLICEFLREIGGDCDVDRVWTRHDFERALATKSYDLILADHQLPAFDGEAALEIAQQVAPDVPFIFVSGTLGEEVAVDALKRGATDYVVKQRLFRLPSVVRRALAEAVDRKKRHQAEAALKRLNETLEARVVAAIREREATLAQLADLQKLETIGQLTGGVAHDFNNLLTPILGNLDMLRSRLADDDRAQRLIGGAMQGAERAKTLVQRLLAFARRQVLEPQAVDTSALVDGLVELISRTIGPQIRIAVEHPARVAPARIDPGQLELALLNLAVNARDAMPGGGTLTIAVDTQAIQAGHALALRHGDYVRISVSDSGVGMDAATLKRAVEPFFSTKGVGKGTGLGLSMVDGFAAQSGGTLVLASEPGQGTRAEIWLPVADTLPEAAQAAQAAGAAPLPATPRATILLVDDEELVRTGTAEMLAELGHAVVEAESATQALDLLAAGTEPDLLVTDYLMPGMNGAELAAEMRRLRPRLPILLATGYANLAGHQMASVSLLAKPFRQAELAARLHDLLVPRESDGPERLRLVE